MRQAGASRGINKRRLWVLVLSLWGLWAIRAHGIMALPIFVDESLHIMRAQVVFEFSDAKASILPAKLLLYYYLGLFGTQDVGGAWVAREAVALLAPLGSALSFALARRLFKRWQVGFWAVILYGLTPFLIFFERMALADTFVMLFGLALAIVAIDLAKNPSRKNAVVVGLVMGVALLAKLTALPWAVLPPLAFYLFDQRDWRAWREPLTVAAVVTGLCFVPSVVYMAYQELRPPENKIEAVEQDLFVPANNGRVAQIWDNVETYAEAGVNLFGWPLVILLVGLGSWQFYRSPKATLYLLVFSAVIWAFIIVTAARPSARYLVMSVPALLIVGAAGLDGLWQVAMTHQQRMAQVLLGIVTVLMILWAAGGLRFAMTAWDDPARLALAEREVWEYYENTAAGYGLREAAADLPHLMPLQGDKIQVAGFVGACHSLRLYLPKNAVEMECPYFRWSADLAAETLAHWQARVEADGAWYFLADDEQPMALFELPLEWALLEHYERPHDGVGIGLYRVSPLKEKP